MTRDWRRPIQSTEQNFKKQEEKKKTDQTICGQRIVHREEWFNYSRVKNYFHYLRIFFFFKAGCSVHGIFQPRILDWVAISFSRDLPDPGIKPESLSSLVGRQILYHWATRYLLISRAKFCLLRFYTRKKHPNEYSCQQYGFHTHQKRLA